MCERVLVADCVWLGLCLWMMMVAAGCRQDVRMHKHECMCVSVTVFQSECVSLNVGGWCYLVGVLCMFMCVSVWLWWGGGVEGVRGFCLHGSDYHSKSACYSWVNAIVFSQCLGLSLFVDKRMLWGKWFSTCQSEEKDKRWEKREVRDGERENDGGFHGNNERSRRVKTKEKGERRRKSPNKQRAVLNENLNLAPDHHIAQVPASSFPQEMTASISVELFA